MIAIVMSFVEFFIMPSYSGRGVVGPAEAPSIVSNPSLRYAEKEGEPSHADSGPRLARGGAVVRRKAGRLIRGSSKTRQTEKLA